MAAWSFLAEHRDEAGHNANKSKEDMKTDDCEKHRGRGRYIDTRHDRGVLHSHGSSCQVE
jgi:hypothetical protein